MQSEIITIEPAPEQQAIALKIDTGLEPETARSLQDAFGSYFQQADEWRAKALGIRITSPTQFREMKLARETRLALREIRINAEKTRKRLKEDSLRKGKAIDGIYNMLEFAVKPLEEHLLAQEQFIQRLEDERKAKLKAEREALLQPFGVDCTLYQLGEMEQATFDQLLETNRLAFHARQEAAKKAEAERIAREQREARERAEREAAEAAERERLRQENERLQREKAEAEAKARAEREKAEAERREAEAKARQEAMRAQQERIAIQQKANEERLAAEEKARAERAAREKAEAELRAQREAEERRRQEQEAAARALAMAPDRDKLAAFAAAVRALQIPELDSELGKAIEATLRDQVAKFAAWADAQARKLNA